MPAMPRPLLLLPLILLPACYVEKIEAIIAKYDTIDWSDSSASGDTSPASSTTGEDTTADTDETNTTSTTSTTSGAGDSDDASSDTTTALSTSTGPAAPFCGDGILDPGETCDDMNDDPNDGCKLCTLDRIVFVTSKNYQGLAIGGLYLADQRCRMHAAIADLPNFATYRAWLSDSTTAAADRITHSKGRYVLVNGLVVADDWDDLTDGTIQNRINATEFSEIPGGGAGVWTGTLPDGQPAFDGSFCDDWTNTGRGFPDGGRGSSDQTDGWWSFLSSTDCGDECALYCFEN